MKFSKIKNSVSGETLIEVLLAVSVLMLVIVPAGELKVKSIRDLAFNRNHLIAETLANEEIEAISGIISTNALKFSDKAKECWNTKPDYTDSDTCEKSENKIEAGSYILKRDTSALKWSLKNISANVIPDDFNFTEDSEYRLKLNSDTQLYNHDSGDPTNFYREIYMEYDGNEKMNVLARVFFKNGAKIKTVKRFYYLTNQTE